MRKTLTTAATLVAMAAAFVAVAAGGTSARQSDSTRQRVTIEVTGKDPFHALMNGAEGTVTFCCWSESRVVRAGSSLLVTNPRLTFSGKRGTLKIRERIEWVDLPQRHSVQTGTWKFVGGTGAYSGLSGHGRVASVVNGEGYVRLRLFGFLESK
jgi:hypothetical protein